jgi:hypothetical protein
MAGNEIVLCFAMNHKEGGNTDKKGDSNRNSHSNPISGTRWRSRLGTRNAADIKLAARSFLRNGTAREFLKNIVKLWVRQAFSGGKLY